MHVFSLWMYSQSCRGVCMYRTVKTHDLILKGVPDSLRAEVWLIFSGAINQVTVPVTDEYKAEGFDEVDQLIHSMSSCQFHSDR